MAQIIGATLGLLSDKIAATAIIVGFLQFVALVATVAVMTVTARRQLRAYVLVKGARLEHWDNVDDPAIATVVVRNYGQTLAYFCRFRACRDRRA